MFANPNQRKNTQNVLPHGCICSEFGSSQLVRQRKFNRQKVSDSSQNLKPIQGQEQVKKVSISGLQKRKQQPDTKKGDQLVRQQTLGSILVPDNAPNRIGHHPHLQQIKPLILNRPSTFFQCKLPTRIMSPIQNEFPLYSPVVLSRLPQQVPTSYSRLQSNLMVANRPRMSCMDGETTRLCKANLTVPQSHAVAPFRTSTVMQTLRPPRQGVQASRKTQSSSLSTQVNKQSNIMDDWRNPAVEERWPLVSDIHLQESFDSGIEQNATQRLQMKNIQSVDCSRLEDDLEASFSLGNTSRFQSEVSFARSQAFKIRVIPCAFQANILKASHLETRYM